MSFLTEAPALPARQEAILARLHELPPFSPVLNQLLASLGDESFSYRQLGRLIEQDTVLTGNVLRLVNSAAYARRAEVMAISNAISILGLNKLRNLVLTLSVANMWRRINTPSGWSLERFNAHSLATAILCDGIAQRKEVAFPEGAFLAGLLHDLGKLLIVMASPADHLDIAAYAQQQGCSILEAELYILETDHACLSAEALSRWNLPLALQQAVRDHHTPVAGELSEFVAVANSCAVRLGYGIAEPGEPQDCLPLLDEIGLDGEAVLADFAVDFEAAKALR
ncbi:MAG: HDOD domain-containing protein [Bryobacteraceae bacterium]|nr:HDOD domain-containing protein [Bryobacteraceae bacterium]